MDSLLEPISNTEEQQFCVEMMKRLDIQRKNEHFCDVILEVGSGDDQARLEAHRIVLCAASPFFLNALNIDMKEKKEGVIRLQETSKAAMEEVLEYLYTGHVDINEGNAFDLMAAADYFLIPSLKHPCSKFIENALSSSNCISTYYFGVKYQCAELEERARNFILRNFVAVAESKDFLNLSSKEVEEWISSDDIIVKGEEEVFVAILKWIEKAARRKQSFFDLFRHVRCVYVSRNYLVTVILQHRLVKDKKRCLDLVLDAMKKSSDGTDACFLSQSPRNCLKTHEDAVFACADQSTLCYIPSKNKWYQMVGMRAKRNSSALATSTCHGKLYVVGGNYSGYAVERYDPMLNSWSAVKSFRPTQIQNAAAVTFQGFLYVIGGNKGLVHTNSGMSTVQRYNPDTNLWQEVAPLSGTRYSLCAVADDNHIYAIGGIGPAGTVNTVERFDPGKNCWEQMAPTLEKRQGASAVSLNGTIFVFGGLVGDVASEGYPYEIYNKAENLWSALHSEFSSISSASAVCFKGKIFVFGKFREVENTRKELTMKVYDADEDEWEPCLGFSFIDPTEFYKLSSVRILKELLEPRKVISMA